MSSDRQPFEDLIGSVIAHCEILKALGSGGMGAVYKAKDLGTGEYVAIKVLPSALAQDEEFLHAFWREARVLALCDHPNIVKLLDFGYDREGRQFIIMEYVDGPSAQKLVESGGPLAMEEVIVIAKQALSALAYAHERSVVHQDLKPDNMLLKDGRILKLVDFGIARKLDEEADLTAFSGILVGTPSYMSPEQCDSLPLDGRSDLYSLGASLFFISTGRKCFDGNSPLSIMLKQKFEPAPDPRKFNPEIPEVLARFILWLLTKKRERRPQSAEEALKFLESMNVKTTHSDFRKKPTA